MENKMPKVGARFKRKFYVTENSPHDVYKIAGYGEAHVTYGNCRAGEKPAELVFLHQENGYHKTAVLLEQLCDFYNELPEEAISKMETTEKIPELNKLYRRLDSTGAWKCSELYIARTPDGPRFAYMQSDDGKVGEKFNLRDGFWKHFEEIETHKEEEKPTPYIDSVHKENDSVHSAVDKANTHHLNTAASGEYTPVDKALEDEKSWTHAYHTLKADLQKRKWGRLLTPNEALKELTELRVIAQNLVNALEEEKKLHRQNVDQALLAGSTIPQTPVSGGIESARESIEENNPDLEFDWEEIDKKRAENSIWKDVSELRAGCDIIVKYRDNSYVLHKTIAWQSKDSKGDIWFKQGENSRSKPPEDAVFLTLADFITDYESEKKARVELEGRVGKLEKQQGPTHHGGRGLDVDKIVKGFMKNN